MYYYNINIKNYNITARICSAHFLPACYKQKPDYYGSYSPRTVRNILPDAVPTENIFVENQDERENENRVLR